MESTLAKFHDAALVAARASVADAKAQVAAELKRNPDCKAALTPHTVKGAARRAIAAVNAKSLLDTLTEEVTAQLLAENNLKDDAEPSDD